MRLRCGRWMRPWQGSSGWGDSRSVEARTQELATLVVVSAGHDFDALINAAFPGDAIDEPMLTGDATRPPPGEIAIQWLRLAEAGEWPSPRILDQFIEPAKRVRIVSEPVLVVLPRNVCEVDIHRPGAGFANGRLRAAPVSAARIERSNLAAFAGLESRCTVSCQPANSSSESMTTLPLPLWRVTTIGARLSTASSR